MMESYTERMNQQREQEALLAAQRKQELLAQRQAAQEKEKPPQNSDFRQLIEEMCGTKASAQQKQKLEDTMLELLEDCRQKELYCMHNDVEDLIESALNSKLLLINLKSQRLDKEKQEVKNIAEPAAKRRTRITLCLYFKVIHKESIIPLNKTPQISSVIAITHDLPTKEPEYSLTDFDLEEEIRLVENFLYDNSSTQPSEELNVEITNMIFESLSPSPIHVEDSDSYMEEIVLFLATDDSMPPGIKNDDYDSEEEICFLEELLSNDSPTLLENESSNLDYFNDSSSPRPPPEPPDVEICLNFEPHAGILTTKMVKGISEHYVLMPNILPTLPTLDPDSDFTPSHNSLRSGNKIFDPGIFIKVHSERFYHGMNFQSHSSVILFLQCLTLCFCFRLKTRTKCSNLEFFLIFSYLIRTKSLLIFLRTR
ncbi:hypothetical protein Tco_0127701 [Tanacetum coccineum]